MTLRRYANAPDYLQGVFQCGTIVRRRTLILDRFDASDMLTEYTFSERWRICVPLQLFRCEMQAAVEPGCGAARPRKSGSASKSGAMAEQARVSFELRRDPVTMLTYFGIIQDSMGRDNDLWLPAPMQEARVGQNYIEFNVKESGKNVCAPAAHQVSEFTNTVHARAGGYGEGEGEPMDVYKNMYKRDFSKMDVVFAGMAFSAMYLAKFVEHIDGTDFIRLVISPDVKGDDGVPNPQPAVVEHIIGKYAKFRYMLIQVPETDAAGDSDSDDGGDSVDSGAGAGSRGGRTADNDDGGNDSSNDGDDGDDDDDDDDNILAGKGGCTTVAAGSEMRDRASAGESGGDDSAADSTEDSGERSCFDSGAAEDDRDAKGGAATVLSGSASGGGRAPVVVGDDGHGSVDQHGRVAGNDTNNTYREGAQAAEGTEETEEDGADSDDMS